MEASLLADSSGTLWPRPVKMYMYFRTFNPKGSYMWSIFNWEVVAPGQSETCGTTTSDGDKTGMYIHAAFSNIILTDITIERIRALEERRRTGASALTSNKDGREEWRDTSGFCKQYNGRGAARRGGHPGHQSLKNPFPR